MSDDIAFSCERHIGIVTLQRLKALNALTLPMIIAFHKQLHAWQNDRNIHAVVVRSSNEKAFCAGGDVRWLFEMGSHSHLEQMQFFWHEYRLNHTIYHFKKPYIALMDGITMGGGLEISLHGSNPVATERFVFAMPETAIGFFPDVGASYLLSRCPNSAGVYLGLTGNRLEAGDAHAVGLVKHTVPSQSLNEIMTCLINADLSVEAQAKVNACLHRFAMPNTVAPMISLQTKISQCFGMSEMASILKTLAERDAWHQDILKCLSQKSPFSLKVTLAQLHKAKTMTFDDCIKMDYCLAGHFVRGTDFYEGVRALLIDKDNQPQWQPKTFSDVTDQQIARYFESGQPDLPLLS